MALKVDIQKRLGAFKLNVRFETQGRLALLGASGSGKSVALKCISGIMRPDSGHIELNGRTLFDSARRIDRRPQERRIGYLFQQYALFPNMTLKQNVLAGARKRPKGEREAAVEDILARLRLNGLEGKRPGQLSGGEQQRAALARILVSSPDAILLDEPFSSLDSHLKWQLEAELSDTLLEFPGPVVWVSHDRGEVYRNCVEVCALNAGAAEPVVSMERFMVDPGSVSAARLSGCRNCIPALPAPGGVRIPGWGVTLNCGPNAPGSVFAIGIRADRVRVAEAGDRENRIPCRVTRVTRDIDCVIMMLRPEGASDGAIELCMEADAALPREFVEIRIDPSDIMILNETGG